MGDDSRGEYIYKFVSAAPWDAADANAADRIAIGDKYLDRGRLDVARFNADGSGDWLELAIDAPATAGFAGQAFADQADVLVNAPPGRRRAGRDQDGPARMVRGAPGSRRDPDTGEIYYTLTNNSNRKLQAASGAQQSVDAANPRAYSDSYAGAAAGSPGNINGHLIRIAESGGDSARPAASAGTCTCSARSPTPTRAASTCRR